MNIIAFGDIHMAAQNCRNIPNISKADLLIITGDLTNYGKCPEAKEVLDELLSLNPQLLAIFGNLDNHEINDYLEKLEMNLHGQARLVQNKVCCIGVGGSNITPFDTPAEFSEEELAEILQRAHRQGKEYISLAMSMKKCTIPLILISHPPPLGTNVDRLSDGQHVGSAAVRHFIEEHQPALCITGHIHEAKGEDHIGTTHIINPGMLQHGGYVDIRFDQTTLQAELK